MDLDFRLEDSFVISYAQRRPEWGPLGYVTYKRTYARPIDTLHERYRKLAEENDLSGTEEWWLTVCRVVEGTYRIQEGHCKHLRLRWNEKKARRSAHEMFERIFTFKFLPPGRGLWMMGTDYVMEKGAAALNNCGFVSTAHIDEDFADPFTFLMGMSMLGVGVGGDCKGAGKVVIQEPGLGPEHQVEDSREGWVALMKRVLNSYVGEDTMPSTIDYSKVRLKGAPIRGFGGTASGPEPLAEAVEDVSNVLHSRVGQKITSQDIVDIFNLIGRCVVAGNVRRTAEIMFGEPDDIDFLELKNRELYPEECDHHRWASNNSVLATVGMDYADVAKRTAMNGEPGYFWLENAKNYGRMGREPDYADLGVQGGNPCLEQSLEDLELCCLVETFPSLHDNYYEFERTLKFAYLYAKTVTLLSTHEPRTNAVLLRNRRIGASQSGIVQAMKKHGRRQFFEWSDEGYDYLKGLDETYSRWLCIPMSVKMTSVKPSGTVSLLPGVTPGIHYPHSEYYWRVIRFKSDSTMLPKIREAGYPCIELDQAKEPDTVAVYFPVKEEHFDRAKADVSIWEQLENAAQVQQYWADNQVSCTVTFKPEEAGQIEQALELYETRLKGISFLPLNDHGYAHAPYQTMTEEEYEHYSTKVKPIDFFNGSAKNEVIDKFCDGESCAI